MTAGAALLLPGGGCANSEKIADEDRTRDAQDG
jgi:hypothetical protein